MVFRALDGAGGVLAERTYYSVGGGFVVDEAATGADRVVLDTTPLPFPFTTGAQRLEHCSRQGLSISDVMLANEQAWRTEAEVRSGMLHLWSVMAACVQRGCSRTEPVLPGGLRVPPAPRRCTGS
jgi:L-serine dehydratase